MRKQFLMFLLILCLGMTCKDGAENSNDTGTSATDADSDTGGNANTEGNGDSEALALKMEAVVPSHPNILYTGRIDFSNVDAPTFAFPAISIRMKFTGRGVNVTLGDSQTYHTNYYYAIIDGGTPQKLGVNAPKMEFELDHDLAAGEHEVEIVRLGEASTGTGSFLGFAIEAGGSVLELESRPHRVEFIGDSITCGYGNEIETDSPDDFSYTTENSNAYLAWGAVAARALDAAYMAVSYSGKGVTRNFGGAAGDTIPDLYDRIFPDDASRPLWDFSSYTPDLVVINLGTNDFSNGLEVDTTYPQMRADYVADYTAFAERVRGNYPDARIVLAVGTMMSDYYPVGYDVWTAIQEDVTGVVDARVLAGDTNIDMLVMSPQTAPYGEDWHPTVATHARMADNLVAHINDNGGL